MLFLLFLLAAQLQSLSFHFLFFIFPLHDECEVHFGHGFVEGSEQQHHVEPALVDESLVENRD